MSPHPPPLRTVRGTYMPYGSSLLRVISHLHVQVLVTGFVEVEQIFCLISPSISHPDEVVSLQLFAVEQMFVADRALPGLSLSHLVVLGALTPSCGPLLGLSMMPVLFEHWVIWGCLAFDFDMAFDGDHR